MLNKKTRKLIILFLALIITLFSTSLIKKEIITTEKDTKSSLSITGNVVKVVDGDTVDVSIKGNVKRIRLLGVNTPETVDPRKPVECFGKEASNKTKTELLDKNVTLEQDPTQADIDKYGRLLRYIYLEDGTNYNKKIIVDGYAYEYTYETPYKFQKEFKEAQKFAEENRKGLWAEEICSN